MTRALFCCRGTALACHAVEWSPICPWVVGRMVCGVVGVATMGGATPPLVLVTTVLAHARMLPQLQPARLRAVPVDCATSQVSRQRVAQTTSFNNQPPQRNARTTGRQQQVPYHKMPARTAPNLLTTHQRLRFYFNLPCHGTRTCRAVQSVMRRRHAINP